MQEVVGYRVRNVHEKRDATRCVSYSTSDPRGETFRSARSHNFSPCPRLLLSHLHAREPTSSATLISQGKVGSNEELPHDRVGWCCGDLLAGPDAHAGEIGGRDRPCDERRDDAQGAAAPQHNCATAICTLLFSLKEVFAMQPDDFVSRRGSSSRTSSPTWRSPTTPLARSSRSLA